MRYDWMTVLIIPEGSYQAAERLGQQVVIEGGNTSPTYSVALSATGDAPVQFRACCTAVSETMLQEMQAVLRSNALPGVRYWRWSSQWGILAATNAPQSQNRLGEAWDWMRCLSDANLHVVGGTAGWD